MAKLLLTDRPSQMDKATFVATYGDVFEHSPWVAEEAYDRGLSEAHDEPGMLAEHMGKVLEDADIERQMQVIRAHPDLAGKAAAAGELTDDSTREQAGAGLDQCTADELARFTHLNDAYKARFGFPFIMAVKGGNRHAILAAFEERLNNSIDQERDEAVLQINRIARFRLEDRAR
ncbi:2-oxo-4-hydroxy-4-carboxy-5-ureidoimidazoline decarboxylase [Halomonas binhaiensis]|uniref:2-oxo-4-hydroxy-4-carboxy-5-ureidoimidazoline decarboxylase n=1 Tax=Halomonas binhaiensis TaxID=2562282 RepID=A0A5C1NJ06_9GAMM|nr:2-oxo-4-hydroxy-4-carboxy-5-ureidoimidazoline decarboxylase [Halomonas binhaiensis]QEM82840.1 2-oxo-4-hydroxy-4-carboxy-5-ureidoimidazoline decarboxylase [Halomonas binhaiensis]